MLVAQMVCLQYGRPRFDPSLGKIPWRRRWQSTSVLLPGKSHGQRSLVGYSPWGCRVRHDWGTSLSLSLFKHWMLPWILSWDPNKRCKQDGRFLSFPCSFPRVNLWAVEGDPAPSSTDMLCTFTWILPYVCWSSYVAEYGSQHHMLVPAVGREKKVEDKWLSFRGVI